MSSRDPDRPGEPNEPERVADGRPPVRERRYRLALIGAAVASGIAAVAVAALLITMFQRHQEARNPYVMFVDVDEDTTDPAVWGVNWPRQYDSFRRTVDYERTRYGGSDAIPIQKLDAYPWLRTMWAGYAFSLDYRESRGHAYTLHDQDHTERVLQRPQPGACLHCHASIMPAYRYMGDGDVMLGFSRVSSMSWNDARHMLDSLGTPLIQHPVSCVDCHSPDNMSLRVTRPAFIVGIRDYMAHQGVADFDVNRDASRQQMRSYVCAQCHVEYHFSPEDKRVIYPWRHGLRVEQMEAFYDSIGFSDWTHGITGGGMLKAQHPEFELWSQGVHAQAGVACADCHMPYRREGAMKVSDHHVRSPMLNIQRACITCHNVAEEQLRDRVHTIQDRTQALIQRSATALMSMIDAIAIARERGATDAQLERALKLQRSAQWRIDFIFSEGSHGFHASQEAARVLAEAIDYARQGEAAALAVFTPASDPSRHLGAPVHGVTPDSAAPPGQVGRPGGAGGQDGQQPRSQQPRSQQPPAQQQPPPRQQPPS
ncbi:ammonia-forming cytochrome c nitrite reductase subunit c552 [soil metagenome]